MYAECCVEFPNARLGNNKQWDIVCVQYARLQLYDPVLTALDVLVSQFNKLVQAQPPGHDCNTTHTQVTLQK